jgi:hypothetical protein
MSISLHVLCTYLLVGGAALSLANLVIVNGHHPPQAFTSQFLKRSGPENVVDGEQS